MEDLAPDRKDDVTGGDEHALSEGRPAEVGPPIADWVTIAVAVLVVLGLLLLIAFIL